MPLQEIKKWLKDQGKSETGEPIYKLVWSDHETEKRFGTFNDFYNDIFLRRVTETREVPKYPHIRERWVLEKWAGGSYEPLFVFQTKTGEPLEVVRWAVEFVVNFAENRVKSIDPDPESLERKQFEWFLDAIDTSPIQSQLHMKEAIIRP